MTIHKIFLKAYLFYVLYMNILAASTYVNGEHACCLQRQEGSTGFPGPGVTVINHHVMLGTEPGSLGRPISVLD